VAPPRWALRIYWAIDNGLDRLSGGRVDTRRSMGISRLFLTTTGRKSGEQREVGVFYLPHGSGFAIVPSNAGEDRDPAWWLNLKANSAGTIRVGRAAPRPVRAREATPVEESELWPKLVKANPDYAKYRAGTTRSIPVVILEPVTS
jgi:deazaflavin-dependent oxidoreductase (nitroreductase family)